MVLAKVRTTPAICHYIGFLYYRQGDYPLLDATTLMRVHGVISEYFTSWLSIHLSTQGTLRVYPVISHMLP